MSRRDRAAEPEDRRAAGTRKLCPLKWQQPKLSGALKLDKKQLAVSFIPSVVAWFCLFPPFQHF